MGETIAFWISSICAVVSAIGVVIARKVIYSVVSLIICLFSVAVLYILLYAPFLAAVQILLYAGGIAVLTLFAITAALQKGDLPMENINRIHPWGMALVLLGSPFLIYLIASVKWPISSEWAPRITNPMQVIIPVAQGQEILQGEYNLRLIGDALTRTYVLPFELLGLILLGVMVGVILMLRPETEEEKR
ncbi:MAG: NADH-quinone oxidoreductase subunit J [bacterium]